MESDAPRSTYAHTCTCTCRHAEKRVPLRPRALLPTAPLPRPPPRRRRFSSCNAALWWLLRGVVLVARAARAEPEETTAYKGEDDEEEDDYASNDHAGQCAWVDLAAVVALRAADLSR